MKKAAAILAILSIVPVAAAAGVDTNVTVRAVSRDAKVLGDGVGGAEIRIIDVKSGEVLASGKQTGSTGDTESIMSRPRVRGERIYDGAAAWTGTVSLDEPTVVRIEATGPLGYPSATRTASKELLLVPGEHIEGDGVILEIHGFIVDLAGTARNGEQVELVAKVTMSCGCPLEPGGMWDADGIRVVARYRERGEIRETRLDWAGTPSMFRASISADDGTPIEVLAIDPSRENFGRAVFEP